MIYPTIMFKGLFGGKTEPYQGPVRQLPEVVSEKDIEFSPGRFADVHRSKEAGRPMPLILYFGSGAMGHGGRACSDEICRALASRGFSVINPDVRPVSRRCVYESVEDSATLMKWIVSEADGRGFDVNRIYLMGSGRGALQAAWTCLLCTGSRFRDAADVDCPELPISGYGAFSPVTGPDNLKMKRAFKEADRRRPGLRKFADLSTNHGLDLLPDTFIISGLGETKDRDASELGDMVSGAGVRCSLMNFEDGEDISPGFLERNPWMPQSIRAVSAMILFLADE